MKKTFVAILVAATMVACAKEDVISQNNEAIGFKQAFVDNSVRSVNDPSYVEGGNMFTDFAVFGTVQDAPLFTATQVANEGIDNGDLNSAWKYKGTQYWIAGALYNFAAVAPYAEGKNATFAVTENAGNYVGTTTLQDYSNEGTVDLLYAQHPQIAGKVNDNDEVDFTFKHILSKVKFSFENAYDASTAAIAVRDIKIVNAYTTADVELKLNGEDVVATWSGHEGTQTLNFGQATDDESTSDKVAADVLYYGKGKTYESNNELFLIPSAARDYQIEFIVDLYVNGTLIQSYPHTVATSSHATVNFAPAFGYSYDIKATITAKNIDPENEQEPIEFTVKPLPGWDTGADQTATVPETKLD